MAKKKEGQRLSIYLTSEALEIYDSWPRHERSKMVSEAIIEKHSKTKETFTEEQLETIRKEIFTDYRVEYLLRDKIKQIIKESDE